MNDKFEEMSEADFRYYLDKLLKGIDDKFGMFTKQQDRIEEKVDDIWTTIDIMKAQIASQCDNCQNTNDVTELKKNVGELMIIKKYWKVFVTALVAVGIVGIITWTEAIQRLKTKVFDNTEYIQEQDSIQAIKDDKEVKSILKN